MTLLGRKGGDNAGRDEGFCPQLPGSKGFKHIPKRAAGKMGFSQSKVVPTPTRTRKRGKRRRLCSEETKHQSEETS